MVTYIINTSENRTFDTGKLFSLTGYMKIVWINSQLDEIGKCSEEIYNRQNVLGAEDFRIAVIVDFYNFKHIRLPYAETGYSKEQEKEGVDLSIYYPFIECYIIDHLFEKITQRNLIISQRDIYYVQNSAFERLENIDNAEEQLQRILVGENEQEISNENAIRFEREKHEYVKKEVKVIKDVKEKDFTKDIEYKEVDEKKYTDEQIEKRRKLYVPYESFKLSCTESLTLEFKMSDYPYTGDNAITIHDFYEAIISRTKKIKRHYYLSSNSGTTIMAAYDTLNLSLYLIEMYEQEENPSHDGAIEIKKIDPVKLKKVLVQSWNKVCNAQQKAKENETKYLDVKTVINTQREVVEPRKKKNLKVEIDYSYNNPQNTKKRNSMSIDQLYNEIKVYTSHTKFGMSRTDINELNAIISGYLERRDDFREQSMENEFDEIKKDDENFTTKCPPRVIYDKLTQEKDKEIADIFKQTLQSEYINVNYENQKEESEVLKAKYDKLKEYKAGNPIATIVFNILICLVLIVPYAFIQRKFEGLFNVGSLVLYAIHLGFIISVLFLSFAILNTVINIRLNRIKKRMRNCLMECQKKKEISLSMFKKRYTEELLDIEKLRFKIRLIKQCKEYNDRKELHVKLHRSELESLENHLSSILNNLGIEAVMDHNINVESEFNINEPIESPHNKVYKIFDIETIEDLFADKGGAE